VNHVKAAWVAPAACAVLALSVAMSAPASAASASPIKVGDVQKAIETVAKVDGVVGAIGEVYVDGKPVGKGSAGSRLLEGKGGKIPSDSRYRIGSQTKQMTATIVLQMVKEKKLGLDDKLSEVLPEVAAKDLVERADEITVQNLIDMTSGIPDHLPLDVFDFATAYSPTELLEISRKKPRKVEIGTWEYSNVNYILLGLMIEKLSGRTLPAEFDRRLFGPLRMNDTYLLTKPPQGIKGPHGHGYWADESGKLRDVDRLNASTFLGAGGVVSTARDVSKFQSAFQKDKLLPDELQKVITDPPPGQAPPPSGGPCAGKPEIAPSHVGAAPGFIATTYTSTDGRLQFAVSATTSGDEATRAAVRTATSQAVKTLFCPTK
jgi:D-alanyl-D-alanine carboxypeptidase